MRKLIIGIAVVAALMHAGPIVHGQGPETNGIAPPSTSPGAYGDGAGDVPIGGLWQEFGFSGVGEPARGCFPADPGGGGCTASSAGNSKFAAAPPWTFTAPPDGVVLVVTDAFTNGDVFEVFDFGASIGTTPAVAVAGGCGNDPKPCLADPAASSRSFALAGGAHEITIAPTVSPFSGGSAYFRVSGAVGGIAELPDADAVSLTASPASAISTGALVGIVAGGTLAALAAAAWYARRRVTS